MVNFLLTRAKTQAQSYRQYQGASDKRSEARRSFAPHAYFWTLLFDYAAALAAPIDFSMDSALETSKAPAFSTASDLTISFSA